MGILSPFAALLKRLKERASSKKMSGFRSEMRVFEETLTLARKELGDPEEIDRDLVMESLRADPEAKEILETACSDLELGIIELVGRLDRETR